MDFAALMAAQIAKAKGGSASSSSGATKNGTDAAPPAPAAAKFISVSEAERRREEVYREEQARLAAEREAKAAAKRKREEEAEEEAKRREERRRELAEKSRRRREELAAAEERARRKRLGLPELPPDSADGNGGDPEADEAEREEEEELAAGIPDEETLCARLRAVGQPVLLSGETRRARLRRLLLAADVPIPTTLPPVQEKDMKLDGTVPASRAGKRRLFRQLASYFNMVLRAWEDTLAEEGIEAGSKAASTMTQSRDTMKPLFRKLEKSELDDSVLLPIVEIVKAAQERRYVDANDGYLRLSIGRAAWPIGVTMVGIHERSAREKLHAGEKGHVMGDEVTRKYLQSIKRMLTFAQTRWPPHDINQLMG